jgi:hypothetical protein
MRQLLQHRLQRRRHARIGRRRRHSSLGDKETTYIVDKMVGTRWNQGSREYLVRWKGYAASADTWEPMENLVGCAQQIREYEKLRGKEDIEAKAAVLAKAARGEERCSCS